MPTSGKSGLHNPRCPACEKPLSWRHTLKSLLGPARQNQATWGVVCPSCLADLKSDFHCSSSVFRFDVGLSTFSYALHKVIVLLLMSPPPRP